jgi:hypothetical protein
MHRFFVRSSGLSIGLLVVLGFSLRSSGFDDKSKDKDKDNPQTPLEVYEWSIWVGNPAQVTINTARVYKTGMPSSVGTSRPNIEEKDRTIKFPISPISVVQFFGEPCKDVDVDLRIKKGTFLSHWPGSTEHAGRLTWFKSDLSSAPPSGLPQSYLAENHWLTKLRDKDKALYLKHESHFERFIAYDAELAVPVPIKIRGGPDEYTLQNLTNRRLVDVAVIAPTDKGYRVGWLDELPTAAPESPDESADSGKKDDASKKGEDKKGDAKAKKEATKEKGEDKKGDAKAKKDAEAKKTPEQKAEAVFADADTAAKEKKKAEEELPPLPAEGDANIKARVDQVLNRQIQMTVDNAPRKDALAMVAGQARVRYELDDKAIAKAEIDMNQPVSLRAPQIAARDALAEVLGGAGLSYRVTEEGKLFITTAARLAEEDNKKGKVIEGPPVKLVMSQPKPASDPTYRDMTRAAMIRRLVGQGLREDLVNFELDQYGALLFEPKELIVLVHLSRPATDEAVLLDVFPPPKKLVRTATVVMHGIDPRLQDRARGLVQQLGDRSAQTRESAETRLFEMGPAAVPVLEDALSNKDIEIVYRAERLLLKLGRSVP